MINLVRYPMSLHRHTTLNLIKSDIHYQHFFEQLTSPLLPFPGKIYMSFSRSICWKHSKTRSLYYQWSSLNDSRKMYIVS